MNCYVNNLGSIPHNESLSTGLIAAQGGQHVAILFFAGVRIRRTFNVLIGAEIKIPKPFNEDYIYTLNILQPDGTYYKQADCENFAFKTYVSVIEDCIPDCGCLPYETT